MSISGNPKIWGPAELKSAFELDHEFMPFSWSEDEWLKLSSDHLLYLWVRGAEAIGFALFAANQYDEVAHLLKITMNPDFRGTGETQQFWDEIVRSWDNGSWSRMFLEVQESNLAAIHFYKKVGFTELRKIPGFYSNGEGAITMECALS